MFLSRFESCRGRQLEDVVMLELFLFLLVLFVCFAAFEVWRILDEEWDLGEYMKEDDDEDHKIL
jgi:hypothetical protein